MRYGISFSFGNEIYSIYRREFDFEHSYKRIKDALLSIASDDFGQQANTFCLAFYHVNRDGVRKIVEQYYCSFYPDYIKRYLKTQIL